MVEPIQPQATPVPGAEPVTPPVTPPETPPAGPPTTPPETSETPPETPPAEAPPVERTYTQKEWSERESAKDQEISGYQTIASQAALRAQTIQQQQAEAAAQVKDKSDIDEGLITEEEAAKRQQGRQSAIQMQPRLEQMGRMAAAQDFGERYGVNPFELLSDQTIRTPHQMDAKARQLAQTKLDATTKVASDEVDALKARIKALEEGEPQFDQGQQGAGATNLGDLSPAELTAAAYSPREVAKRQKARNK